MGKAARNRGRQERREGGEHRPPRQGPSRPAWAMADDEEPMLCRTSPGCERPSHRDELMGALVAWRMGHQWKQPSVMDCGCSLWIGPEAMTEGEG